MVERGRNIGVDALGSQNWTRPPSITVKMTEGQLNVFLTSPTVRPSNIGSPHTGCHNGEPPGVFMSNGFPRHRSYLHKAKRDPP